MKSFRHMGKGLLVALIIVGFAGPSLADVGMTADRSGNITVGGHADVAGLRTHP